jgi:DNA-binding NarL/FixJ family response regulator
VATLLALGLSNRQIADELVISVATVERHVANILAKLSYRSRTQVAAWAVEQGFLRSPATKQSSPE